MKYWRYITFAVLFTELIVFGENRSGTWALLALVFIVGLANVILDSNPKWISSKKEIQRNNPLPRPVFNGVAIFFSAVAMILPYAEGLINPVLVVLAVCVVTLTNEK